MRSRNYSQSNTLSPEEEISRLKKVFIVQQKLSSPLRFLTGIKLHLKLAQNFSHQHQYDSAIKDYWEVIDNSEKRIEELLEHSKDGFVGEVSSARLIDNSKNYIIDAAINITELTLLKQDIASKSIAIFLPSLSKEFTRYIKRVSKDNIIAGIQEGVLAFAHANTYRLLVNEDNLDFCLDEKNFHLVPHERMYMHMIGISQNATKEIRGEARIDKKVANRCYSFRKRSADYYRLLGDKANYYEEISSAALYKVYSSSSYEEFEKNYAELELTLTEWEKMKKMPRSQPFYYRAFANIFGLNFLELSNTKDRILNLKLINYYLSQTGSGVRSIYKLYENFYVLISRIKNAKDLSSIKLPDQKKFTIPDDTIKADIQETKQNYRNLIKLIQYIKGKKIKSDITNPDILSIYQLYKSAIVSEKVTLDLTKSLIKKFLGEELVPMNVLDEKDDEDLIKKLLKLGESTTLEVKKSLADNESIGRAISAFANTKGGKILIGFDELEKNHTYPEEGVICHDFGIAGLDASKTTLDNQKKKISLHLHESGINVAELIIDSSLIVRGKRICVIEVPESKQKPVFYWHEAYRRVDTQNKKLSNKEAISIFARHSLEFGSLPI